jgi:hypothetical protein
VRGALQGSRRARRRPPPALLPAMQPVSPTPARTLPSYVQFVRLNFSSFFILVREGKKIVPEVHGSSKAYYSLFLDHG